MPYLGPKRPVWRNLCNPFAAKSATVQTTVVTARHRIWRRLDRTLAWVEHRSSLGRILGIALLVFRHVVEDGEFDGAAGVELVFSGGNCGDVFARFEVAHFDFEAGANCGTIKRPANLFSRKR